MKILSISLVLFLLFDQVLSLATHFSSGLGLIFFLALLAISALPRVINKKNKLSYLMGIYKPFEFFVGFIIATLSLLATIYAPCDLTWLFSIATMLLVILAWGILKAYIQANEVKYIIDPIHALAGLIVIYLCLCLSSAGVNLYSILQNSATNRPAGLYLEPSHLVLYAAPLMLVSISNQQTRILGILLSICIYVLAHSATYVVLVGIIMMCYIIYFMANRHRLVNSKGLFVTFVVLILFAVTLHGKYLFDRLVFNKETTQEITQETRNFSTLIYLNGWLLAKTSILKTSGMGLGLGNMGCSSTINNDSQTLTTPIKLYKGNVFTKIIGFRDGSFLASKIISELGVLGIFLIGVVTFKALILFIRMIKKEFDLVLVGSICLLVTLVFIRGLPYFSAPVIFSMIMMILSYKKNN